MIAISRRRSIVESATELAITTPPVNKANAALEGTPLANVDCAFEVCSRLNELPADKQGAVRNNGGGHANHSLFWEILGPGAGGQPSGELSDAITDAFGSFDSFKEQFGNAAATRFGSGWAWLVKNADGGLEVVSTSNAGTPLTEGQTPILTCDVWEHAYYVDYRNARPAYVDHWWELVNWDFAAENLG